MDSASENSFTWTDTSNDSDSIVADDIVSDSTLLDTGMHKKHGKSEVLTNHCNGTAHDNDTKPKIKIEKDQSHFETKNSNSCSSKNKMVKLEPESESDIPKKKKKIKHSKLNRQDLQSSASYDESYLNLKVKQEEMSALSSSISLKKKQKESSNDSKAMEELKYYGNSSEVCGDSHSVKSKKKKKKSKKRNRSGCEDNDDITHNTDLVKRDREKSIEDRTDTSLTVNNTFPDDSGCEEISAIQCEDDDDNLHTISYVAGQATDREIKKKNDSLYKSTIVNQFKSVNNKVNNTFDHDVQILQTVEKRIARLSDRIRFEEDDFDSNFNTQENTVSKTSSKLRKFVKSNINMRSVTQRLHPNSILSNDDEIWIVKCPRDIDVQAFSDTDLNLQHGKCKIKAAGQTYDGSLDDEQSDTAAILSMKYDKFEVENLPICGILNIRKRIPKAHFYDDNIMSNNQTNFIPLPETKCRHPLFGSNYKKALKIPKPVAERLNTLTNPVVEAITNENKKRKKHKKEYLPEYEELSLQNNCIAKPEPDQILEKNQKKKKKRKHSDDEGPAPKKVKRIKHDPESAEAWDSAKAIEQNLFNF